MLHATMKAGESTEVEKKMDESSGAVYCGMNVELMLKMVESPWVQTVGIVM